MLKSNQHIIEARLYGFMAAPEYGYAKIASFKDVTLNNNEVQAQYFARIPYHLKDRFSLSNERACFLIESIKGYYYLGDILLIDGSKLLCYDEFITGFKCFRYKGHNGHHLYQETDE